MELEGHTAIEAENGARGLAEALRNVADLIVCDVMMPELDGFELLGRLRADIGWKEVPFIFLTASAEGDNRVHGLALGAADYMTKPFNLIELMDLVRRRLARE